MESFLLSTTSSFVAGVVATFLGVLFAILVDRRRERAVLRARDVSHVVGLFSFISTRRAFEHDRIGVPIPTPKDDIDLLRCNESILSVRSRIHEVRDGLSAKQADAKQTLLAMELDCATYLSFTESSLGRDWYGDALHALGIRLHEEEKRLAVRLNIAHVPAPGSVEREQDWLAEVTAQASLTR